MSIFSYGFFLCILVLTSSVLKSFYRFIYIYIYQESLIEYVLQTESYNMTDISLLSYTWKVGICLGLYILISVPLFCLISYFLGR